jgi:hypothetical protein
MRAEQFGMATLLALIVLTVASTPWSGQQSSNSYDPWLDYNDDGVIDVTELHRIAEAYGSSGEPARNVTVSSHASWYVRFGGASNISIPALSNWLSEVILIDGYSKVTILIHTSPEVSGIYLDLYACDNNGHTWLVDKPAALIPGNWAKTYDVMNQGIRIVVHNNLPYAITADVAVYLMA